MNRRTTRLAFTVTATAVIAATLTACAASGSASESSAPGKDSIVVAQPDDVKTPDPVLDNGLYSNNIFHSLYDQLTSVDGDGELQPRIATEWTATPDAKSWTFTIQEGLTFTNGEPLTADDVAFSFQAVIDAEESLNKIYTNQIETVTADDDTHVTFVLKNGNAAFPRFAYYISIVPKDYYTAEGADGFAAAPVGSGPYSFVSWTPGVSFVLKANPDYWGEKPAIENVTVQPIADADARLNGLLSGDIDLTSLTPSQVDSVDGAGLTVQEGQSNQLVYVGFQAMTGPLANADLRSAISLAIDRETLMETIQDGYGTVATAASVAPNVAGFDDSLETLPYDPDQARELVASSGYDGTPIEFDYATGGNVPNSAELAQAIASQLEEVGIAVDLKGIEYATFNLMSSSKQYTGMYLTQFSPSMMDAATTLNYLYGPTGFALFSDPEVDSLIIEAGTTVDEQARLDVINEVWALNAEQMYLANIDYTVAAYGLTSGLSWTTRADGQVDWRLASWG
jgi:peptide/nickel transport system substrate-binding protein